MVNSHTFVSNKSRIPIKVYQLNKSHKIAPLSTFKSSSTFNVTKIPKLTKMSDKADPSTLSTNTFNVCDKLLKQRRQFKRAMSFNTESNVSSLSEKSQLTSSSHSVRSAASGERIAQDLMRYIKKKLREMEKRPSMDELGELLAEEARTIGHKKVTLHTLDAIRAKHNSKSQSNSQLSHAKIRTRPESKHKHTLELYFTNLKQIEQLFKSAQRELFDKAMASTSTDQTNRYKQKLKDFIEKFNLLINDKDSGNIGLLSPESYTFSKQDTYKNGEFVLRLVTDLVFKFRLCIKLYAKIVSESGKAKLPLIHKKDDLATNKATIIQNSIENFNESFIKETDCSSLVSDDEQVHSPPASTAEPGESCKKLRKKIHFVNEDLNDLNMYLDSLNSRAERCARLEEQLRSEKEMIKKTEASLRMCEQTEVRRHMEKQLDFLRHKFKISLQDYSIEKICAPEIYTAISDTEFKIFKLNAYLKDLNMNLFYVESKMSLAKKKEARSQPKQPLPRHLPPLYQFKELAVKQFN
ncbi:hypothetical protein BpHYR1_004685 [Brachionus plicatilis]|uniref:Uncharacterized protein n=1 Tax=Brachionus plicatilis TaxID=10195 RepID=A0A3M7R2X9_BRAPC|nr:hypothetical protein BpHYR1_004685 [Brachionus plicatilis]